MRRAVVFDGFCHVCSGSVRFMLKHPAIPPFELIPMQSTAGRMLLVEYGIDVDDPMTFLVLDEGAAYTQSDGVLQVARGLGGFWRVLAVIGGVVPRSWRDWAYRVLARNRYKWFGKRNTCYLPSDE